MNKNATWPIRWKLLGLMWVLALLPVFTVAWIDIKTLAELGTRLATETGQALSDQTRTNLEQHAENTARLITAERRLIESLVQVQAQEAERVLRADAVSHNAKIFWDEDFVDTNPALGLRRDSGKYLQRGSANKQSPVPVSYTQMTMHGVPGVPRENILDDAARLLGMLAMLQTIYAEQSDLVYWQYITLENGLHASYPGNGGNPPNFDPRLRDGYQAQKRHQTLVWSGPHRDPTSRLPMLSATFPLFDQQRRFVGITGIDVPLTRLLETAGMPSHHEGATEILLTTLSPRPARREEITIVARRGDADAGGNWLQKLKPEFFTPIE
ncbi:MAG: PDC sensor domain-containing protein, partial [Burkholderiales bacterium]